MCKKVIETAANVNKEAKVNWNETTKMATITYDNKKTNLDAILKRVADAEHLEKNLLFLFVHLLLKQLQQGQIM